MLVLGIETSCDETSAAVVENGKVLSNVIFSQVSHSPFGGVVPEIASREHIKKIVFVVKRAIDDAGCSIDDVEGIGVTKGPGLVGSLLIGISFAKALAYAKSIPFYGVHHLEGHIFSALIESRPNFPAVAFIVSGGHTHLYYVREPGSYKILGKTRDDAAGEALDKVAKFVGLGYPGGPVIDRLAKNGNPNFHNFPLPMKNKGLEMSFSGLKTAFIYYYRSLDEDFRQAHLNDILASFQNAVVSVLIEKLVNAAQIADTKDLIVAGGVVANSLFRERLAALREMGYSVYLPTPVFATDNAAMIAYASEFHLERGDRSDFDLKPEPYSPLENLL